MANFDLSNLALQAVCPGNEILYDDKGKPSVMVKIPKQTYAQLGMGASEAIYPTFIINGQEVDAIWFSKFPNIIKNGRAYSLPGQDPANNINFETALAACTAKGEGWHLMTQMERGLLINWCENNQFVPLGNNDYGKHVSESNYKAIPASFSSGKTARTATGTGPLTWFHDNTPAGIDGLGGNVRDWSGGIRTVKGELQILANNNGADRANSQAVGGLLWRAIKGDDGSLLEPDGNGTTAGSVKMDWIGGKLTYSTTITDAAPGQHNCNFGVIECDGTIGENTILLLQTLGVLPYNPDGLCKTHLCYFDNKEAERSFVCGGLYSNTSNGLASFYGYSGRTLTNAYIGFRSAFVVLPSV
jgi:sulfatase modifying factor 1